MACSRKGIEVAINKNLQSIIRALAENRARDARALAIDVLEQDTADGNRWLREHCLPRLREINDGPAELPFQYKAFLTAEEPAKTFNEARYFLSEREADLLRHIERMREVGGKLAAMGLRYPNASIMHGESGTGKTMFGRYVASRFGLPFVYVNFSGLVDSYLGSTAKNISKAFEYVRAEPCVFMLDEIDCISENRSAGGADGSAGKEMNRTTITLMQELDRLTNGHIVLAATNRLDIIDGALLRRFSRKHEVMAFGWREKEAMVRRLLDDVGIPYDVDDVASYCVRHVGAQSSCITDTIEAIARSLQDEQPFRLLPAETGGRP